MLLSRLLLPQKQDPATTQTPTGRGVFDGPSPASETGGLFSVVPLGLWLVSEPRGLSFAPSGLVHLAFLTHRFARWAAFFRRFAAGRGVWFGSSIPTEIHAFAVPTLAKNAKVGPPHLMTMLRNVRWRKGGTVRPGFAETEILRSA